MPDTLFENHMKVYVDVAVTFDRSGQMIPLSITWEDGSTYPIDRLLDIRPSFSAKAGGQGDLYLVRIRNTECHLYFERNPESFTGSIGRWFVSRSG